MRDRLWQPANEYNTLIEEIVNSVTHGIGTALSVVALTVMVIFAAMQPNPDPWRIVGVSVFGASLVILYLASTLYHAFQFPPIKRVFHIIDHIGIFLLIAGTYTPFLLITMRDPRGWTLFGVVWGLALVGSIMKLFFTGRFLKLSVACYIGMGWMALVMVNGIAEQLGPRGIMWLVTGGISYTVGVIPFLWNRLPFNHAIWHLFVIGGSTCHFFAVLWHVLPVD